MRFIERVKRWFGKGVVSPEPTTTEKTSQGGQPSFIKDAIEFRWGDDISTYLDWLLKRHTAGGIPSCRLSSIKS